MCMILYHWCVWRWKYCLPFEQDWQTWLVKFKVDRQDWSKEIAPLLLMNLPTEVYFCWRPIDTWCLKGHSSNSLNRAFIASSSAKSVAIELLVSDFLHAFRIGTNIAHSPECACCVFWDFSFGMQLFWGFLSALLPCPRPLLHSAMALRTTTRTHWRHWTANYCAITGEETLDTLTLLTGHCKSCVAS